jgi:hypothetical protein
MPGFTKRTEAEVKPVKLFGHPAPTTTNTDKRPQMATTPRSADRTAKEREKVRQQTKPQLRKHHSRNYTLGDDLFVSVAPQHGRISLVFVDMRGGDPLTTIWNVINGFSHDPHDWFKRRADRLSPAGTILELVKTLLIILGENACALDAIMYWGEPEPHDTAWQDDVWRAVARQEDAWQAVARQEEAQKPEAQPAQLAS